MNQFAEINALLENLKELVEIPSVYSTPEDGMPFGKSVNEALVYTLKLGESFGMITKNYEGYVGEIKVQGPDTKTPETIIGILGHLDVVAGGEGWETDPFCCQVIDNKVYGRGTLDDKGPVLSCLYAMKYLREENKIPSGVEIRMILGTNEEELWEDMAYYVKQAPEFPNMTIVPDANFPAIFCEKGLLDFDLVFTSSSNTPDGATHILSLEGGAARNVVPAKATCRLSANGAEFELNAEGKSTHCMTPEKGKNAISHMVELLHSLDSTSHSDFLNAYHKFIGLTYNGETMGLDFSDELSGKLTFNVGTIKLEANIIRMESNIRYPASVPYETIKDAVNTFSKLSGFQVEVKDHLPSICHDKNSPLIAALTEAYQAVTGDNENEPFAIGGATYARALPGAVAFGPLFPDEDELAHEPNEFIRISSLEKMTRIYIAALLKLMENGPLGG